MSRYACVCVCVRVRVREREIRRERDGQNIDTPPTPPSTTTSPPYVLNRSVMSFPAQPSSILRPPGW